MEESRQLTLRESKSSYFSSFTTQEETKMDLTTLSEAPKLKKLVST